MEFEVAAREYVDVAYQHGAQQVHAIITEQSDTCSDDDNNLADIDKLSMGLCYERLLEKNYCEDYHLDRGVVVEQPVKSFA